MEDYINLKMKRIRKEIRVISLIILGLIFIISVYAAVNYENIEMYISLFIERYGLISLFLIVFVFEFFPQFMSPDYSLLLAIGVGIGLYKSIVVTMIASIVATLLAFYIGYHYGFATIAPLFDKKSLEKTLKFWDKHGKWFVLAAGIVPLPIPYFPLLFGALRMEFPEFIMWGVLPRTIGFIVTGILGYYGLNFFISLI